jgi:hypothetical protein
MTLQNNETNILTLFITKFILIYLNFLIQFG